MSDRPLRLARDAPEPTGWAGSDVPGGLRRARSDPMGHDTASGTPPLLREIFGTSDYVRMLRREIAALGANELAKDAIPAARRELRMLVSQGADAANAIMTAAEQLADLPPDSADYHVDVLATVAEIFAACAFQDLAAQRAARLEHILDTMERRAGRLAAAVGTREAPDLADLVAPVIRTGFHDGPGQPGEGNDQSAIDAILSGEDLDRD
jgi:chemotaxis protein CheZ